MLSLESIKSELNQVHSLLEHLMHSGDLLVDPCLKELSMRRGKMLRPAMVLLFGKMLSQITPVHIELAAVAELIHIASLLHDDVIDHACTRRNHPTANAMWGNTAAVLLGDFLLSRAFSLMSKDVPEGANSILCASSERLCIGELKQNLLRGRMDLSEPDYFGIIRGKTGALFSCGCMLGAIASDASEKQLKAADEYGNNLGIAFQIMDDLIDIRSTSQAAGKTLGTDLLHEKLTLPVIYWLNQIPSERTARVEKLSQVTVSELHTLLSESGSIDYALEQAKKHTQTAASQLNIFADSEARRNLSELAEQIVKSA